MWFDKAELEEVSPELGGLPERPDEVAALGAPSRGLPHCPRCHGAPVELLLLDVAIDFCPSCHGVWLDGGELEALARAQAAEAREQAKESTKEGSYRESPRASAALRSGRVHCVKCSAEAELGETYVAPAGVVCSACFLGGEIDAEREPSDTYENEVARWKLREPDRAIGITAVDIVDALLSGLASGPYCTRCGERRSLCRHG